jgi:hypothetical protein
MAKAPWPAGAGRVPRRQSAPAARDRCRRGPACCPGDEEAHPLQCQPLGVDGKPSQADWEETLTKAVFSDDTPPRWVLLVHHETWLLIERGKWGRKALLSFNLPELFGPRDEKQFRAFAALAGAESVLPAAGGTALLDTLDDSSHKHAFEVSTDLKYALRACIEEIGNEAIRYKREVAKEKVFDRNDIDLADQLSRECLRYMYRLLFLFYIEARPDLGYAPITAESYLKGYSLEHLRELEQMPLTTPESLEGTYFHESLKQLFTLIWEGFPKRGAQGGPQGEIQDELLAGGDQVLDTGFTIAPLQGHLFDPKQTPLLGSVKLRNRVLQKVVRLMSLSGEGSGKTGRKGSSRGRISYGTLGINQLGAVYESLLSFRGFFAEDDLFEVRPDPKRKKDKPAAEGATAMVTTRTLAMLEGATPMTTRTADGAGDARPPRPRRRRTPRSTRWTPPTSCPPARSSQYTDAERLFGGEPRQYKKGTFIYRLAGRAREKSASYYTPEVLTKCLVEHALKELLATCQDGRRHPEAHRLRARHGQRGVLERGHQPVGGGLPAGQAEGAGPDHPARPVHRREAAGEDVHRRQQRVRRGPEPGGGGAGRGVAVAERHLQGQPRAVVRHAAAQRQLAGGRAARRVQRRPAHTRPGREGRG